ncbi:MAG: hypothetical protein R3242_08280, partial [Akkermansiaceae bacterium]|nr:hypothetical protein [Akkermansiaceae bacterium]
YDWAKLLSGSVPLKLSQMYAQQDAGLMKRLLLDLSNFHWKDDGMHVIRIHGEHDAIIECPDDADLKLDGGHLIAMSHARQICDWLNASREALVS